MKTDVHTGVTLPNYSVSMEIPYELRFLGLTLECMEGFFVCPPKESVALRLALEETLAFLIRSYPEPEAWERIHIEFQFNADDAAVIVITNAGPPVHLDRVPQYNSGTPEASDMGGLWYFLALKAVDELSFQNQGKDGWRVIIRKRLSEASSVKKVPTICPEGAPEAKITFTTRLAGPEDAAAIVDLTYDTYRYSYLADGFYYVSKLRQSLEQGKIVCIIVEANGVPVGNSSMLFSSDTPRCGYSCALMVKPAFRQSRAIIYLLKEVERYMSENASKVDLYYASTATKHTGSQKAGAKTGFAPLALLFDVCPELEFRSMKASDGGRRALLHCVHWTSCPKLSVLYLPVRHHAVMAELLAQSGYECKLSGEEAASMAEYSSFTVREYADEGSAYLLLARLGRDFAARVQKQVFKLKGKAIQTVIVLIPAWCSIPPNLDQEMARINAIFAGIKPESAQESYLVYCCLSGPIDFDRIRIKDPLALNLKEHCRHLYQEMIG